MSFLNKLPTKRLDNKIATAAITSVPEQGEQTGGYTAQYAHLSHLPLLPLSSEKADKHRKMHQDHKDRMTKEMHAVDPDQKLNGVGKAFMSVMSTLSGGANPVSVKRWERRLVGLNVMSSNMALEENYELVFTRWTLPATTDSPWFVDVLEGHFLNPESRRAKLGGCATAVKVGVAKHCKVTLKFFDQPVAVEGGKVWTKREKVGAPRCDTIMYLTESGEEAALELVARVQRRCNSVDAGFVFRDFDKEWDVPVL
jgi:hypothetical protein